MREIFFAFLRLGLIAFGGPIAHVGYLRREFVERRQWLPDEQFAHLLALCQFLPGPGSSQMVFSIGLLRARWLGGIAAWLGFLLPSALAMFAFATFVPNLSGPVGAALMHGFKLVAVAIVGYGLLQMARRLTPDLPRFACAGAVAIGASLIQSRWSGLTAVAFVALLGPLIARDSGVPEGSEISVPVRPRTGVALLIVYAALLVASLAGWRDLRLASAAAFYQAGALVFGGGHVVLPLLEHSVVDSGWIGESDFLSGYGAAQSVPGPMFTLAVYLGAHLPDAAGGWKGAAIATLAIFLPGMLLMAGVLPFWQRLARNAAAARALAGINAAVVGLLAAAFYSPVCTGALLGVADIAIAVVGFAMLFRLPPLAVIGWCVAATFLVQA
ncbi:MAG TPA: chromate efflux transporter [Rudaea sp.]